MSITRIRVRKRENPYVQIDKTTISDNRISFRAKGLHAYLLSKPDSWVVHIKQLVKESPREGRDAIASALKELEIAGYITRHKLRNDSGQLVGWETEVFETPELASLDTSEFTPRTDKPSSVSPPRTDKPKSVEPKSVEPKSANPPLVINDSSHNGVVVNKERKKKDLRDRSKTKTNGNRHDEPPPTPEQQDEAIGAVKGLIDGFLGRHTLEPRQAGRQMIDKDGETFTDADHERLRKHRDDQLSRAKEHGIL